LPLKLKTGPAARCGRAALALLAAVSISVLVAPAAQAETKQRTIVTTDPELDDLNSLLRMLLYSNEIDIEGLVYASSQHHYKGVPAAGIPPYRWKAGQSHIEDALDAYDQVDENLRAHDADFPTAAELRSAYRVGNIDVLHDRSASTPGSQLIADVLLDDKPGPVYIQAWGGLSTIARGLMDIEERYRNTPEWDAIYEKVSSKAIITSFGTQDNAYTTYILPVWPRIQNWRVNTNIWGYGTRNSILPEDRFLVDPDWTRDNVSQVGALGALYRVWGDGKFMAENAGPAFEGYPRNNRCMTNCPPGPFFDDEDFFGFDSTLPENSRTNLIARGYNVWTGLQLPRAFISEGDSSNFALLFLNGLRSYEDATWGGWGGRQVRSATNPYLFNPPSNATGDINPATGTRTNGYHASRWWRAIQMDFAARLKWSVTPAFAGANHEPVVAVTSGLNPIASPGEQVRLDGAATDPDGHALTYKWYQYREAGTYPGAVTLSSTNTAASGFQVPADAQPGQKIHAILEVTDAGTPPLTRYQRVVVTVVSKTEAQGQAGGTVPATLSLALGAPVSFGAFTPGVARDYFASTTANVISTAGDATLSVADPSSTNTGHLVNGSFALPQPLQARARNAANTGTAYNNVGSAASPLNLLTYEAPISNDAVTLEFKQWIGANDALRTGTYAKSLTFTLSTTTP
jgi:hypothetical protein